MGLKMTAKHAYQALQDQKDQTRAHATRREKAVDEPRDQGLPCSQCGHVYENADRTLRDSHDQSPETEHAGAPMPEGVSSDRPLSCHRCAHRRRPCCSCRRSSRRAADEAERVRAQEIIRAAGGCERCVRRGRMCCSCRRAARHKGCGADTSHSDSDTCNTRGLPVQEARGVGKDEILIAAGGCDRCVRRGRVCCSCRRAARRGGCCGARRTGVSTVAGAAHLIAIPVEDARDDAASQYTNTGTAFAERQMPKRTQGQAEEDELERAIANSLRDLRLHSGSGATEPPSYSAVMQGHDANGIAV